MTSIELLGWSDWYELTLIWSGNKIKWLRYEVVGLNGLRTIEGRFNDFDRTCSGLNFFFWKSSNDSQETILIRRVSVLKIWKNQTSKEFCRLNDSIPYLDNAELFFLPIFNNEIRLSLCVELTVLSDWMLLLKLNS